VVKRRHGLKRCRDKGEHGMQRRVGFGVIANSNPINIGRVLTSERQSNYGRN
jgi:IS5 family transposase